MLIKILCQCGIVKPYFDIVLGSTSTQVKAFCLTAPSLYLNQCCLAIRSVLWHSLESHFTRSAHQTNPYYVFWDYCLKLLTQLSGVKELTHERHPFDIWTGVVWWHAISNSNNLWMHSALLLQSKSVRRQRKTLILRDIATCREQSLFNSIHKRNHDKVISWIGIIMNAWIMIRRQWDNQTHRAFN